ncbi:unnamed protein product [Caenorhabditis auriculariae]|uniref:BPL/LPL catalytic domain-containing protein n=1 Tax=Caenorhabditis auriculariae TaxID=2777116 RepID=A0A8S1GN27_9PELO|nr:unnamed protein product [Caenorhabditis auriculariae]
MSCSVPEKLEYIFRNHDVAKNGEALITWSNRPAVVFGRHQNPWLEVNLKYAKNNEISVARRHSGGGAVYHDEGNVNFSLLTTHQAHCRPRNLRFVSEALNNAYKLQRDDMELQPGNRKCSGTAARIAHGMAYHHFTLLVVANLKVLSASLNSPHKNLIETTATRSVRAPAVGFLAQDDQRVNVPSVTDVIVRSFCDKNQGAEVEVIDVGFEIENNADMRKIYDELCDWKWIYGKSPSFVYRKDDVAATVKNGIVVESTGSLNAGERFALD